MGRQPAMTKLSSNVAVRRVRVRGGNSKFRALRLDTGNFSWGSEAITRKTRLLDVVYNASNNELVRFPCVGRCDGGCASDHVDHCRSNVAGMVCNTHPPQVRTQTLVKNAVIQIDASPFKTWYQSHYGVEVGIKKRAATTEAAEKEEVKRSNHAARKYKLRLASRKLDQVLGGMCCC